MALYCLDWDGHGRAATVEVRDALTNAVLDTQTVKEHKNGKYLVWNLKGQVTLHVVKAVAGNSVVASGLFFDAPAPTGK